MHRPSYRQRNRLLDHASSEVELQDLSYYFFFEGLVWINIEAMNRSGRHFLRAADRNLELADDSPPLTTVVHLQIVEHHESGMCLLA
jgi:hypothetical protein